MERNIDTAKFRVRLTPPRKEPSIDIVVRFFIVNTFRSTRYQQDARAVAERLFSRAVKQAGY